MRDRNSLHLTRVEAFATYCESLGYERQPPKGEYEILRMVKPGRDPAIVHKRERATEHATIWGESYILFQHWKQSIRGGFYDQDSQRPVLRHQ